MRGRDPPQNSLDDLEDLPDDHRQRQSNAVSFSDGSPHIELPIYKGTVGPDVIDIRKLYGARRQVHLRPRLPVDRRLRIEDHLHRRRQGRTAVPRLPDRAIAVNCDYLETCYLLLNGELPNAEQKKDFENRVIRHTMVNEQMTRFFQGFRRDAHPMAVLVGWWARCRPSITTR
jgi:citrate synthase